MVTACREQRAVGGGLGLGGVIDLLFVWCEHGKGVCLRLAEDGAVNPLAGDGVGAHAYRFEPCLQAHLVELRAGDAFG